MQTSYKINVKSWAWLGNQRINEVGSRSCVMRDCTAIKSGEFGPRGEVEDLEKKAFAEEVSEKTG